MAHVFNVACGGTLKTRRHGRRLTDMLAGRQPLDADVVRRLPLDPKSKRVLLVVVAQRFPDSAPHLLPLAKTLDYQRDATSLCLRKVRE